MVFINYTTMQMAAKIVYYGPGLCGKTTNLQYIHHKTASKSRGEMISLETETDRTLFFDLLPLDVGIIGGMKVRLQLYTVPGQVFYNATRKLVLKGVDGVVFVADSQVAAFDATVESCRNLEANVAEMGLAIEDVPVVFQFNKRDIRNIVPVDKLNEVLNPRGRPFFEAAALHGIGVFETLKAISRFALASVRTKVSSDERKPSVVISSPRASSAPPPMATHSPAPIRPPAAPEPPAPPPAAPIPAAAPAAYAPRAATATAEELKVEFAEEDPERHDLRPVTTKGNLDIQDALAKLRTSVAMTAASRAAAPIVNPTLDRRLQDVLGAMADETRQDVRKKLTVEIPADLLRRSSAVRIEILLERNGAEEALPAPEPIVLKYTPNKKLERVNVRLDLEIKGKT